VKTLEEQVRGRWHTDRWQAPCPACGLEQGWWDTSTGRTCLDSDCSYRLGNPVPAPPIILCSHCGQPLKRLGGDRRRAIGFRCEPCGRTVAP
jgi:hypothetical protein